MASNSAFSIAAKFSRIWSSLRPAPSFSRWSSVISRNRAKYLSGSGRLRMARKSISWIKSRVCPWLRSRTVPTSSSRPGTNRSSPMRSSGPLGMSRTPVASTTIAPGRPSANRPYQSSTSGVTNPSEVARHGTIAGTHVRCSSSIEPTVIGLNSMEASAASAVGHSPGSGSHLTRSGGRHIIRL